MSWYISLTQGYWALWEYDPAWRGRGHSKSLISRVIIVATPIRVLITLLITYLLSPLPLQVEPCKAAEDAKAAALPPAERKVLPWVSPMLFWAFLIIIIL